MPNWGYGTLFVFCSNILYNMEDPFKIGEYPDIPQIYISWGIFMHKMFLEQSPAEKIFGVQIISQRTYFKIM